MKITLLKSIVPYLFLIVFCFQENSQIFSVGNVEYKITSASAPLTVEVKDYVDTLIKHQIYLHL